jgi:hypothetical protein
MMRFDMLYDGDISLEFTMTPQQWAITGFALSFLTPSIVIFDWICEIIHWNPSLPAVIGVPLEIIPFLSLFLSIGISVRQLNNPACQRKVYCKMALAISALFIIIFTLVVIQIFARIKMVLQSS